tara:strand:+ start:330 stop:626 length:297 start_codon:yes stop_codon:yes gene_type:complete
MKIEIEYNGKRTNVTLDKADVLALENDLLDPADWVMKAIAGKVNNCKKRMVKAEVERLKADSTVTSMPATDNDLVLSAVAAPGYMNRVARDAKEGLFK